MKEIIAIIWRAWTGKDLAGDYLSKKIWIPCFQISEALRITARERWVEVSRENLIAIWKEFAEQYWDEYLTKLIIENTDSHKIIITWMRQVGQLEYCKKYHNTVFLWIESDSKIRYTRLLENQKVSGNYEEFLELEKLDEWNIQNVWKCLKLCPKIIENNLSIGDFEQKLLAVLS